MPDYALRHGNAAVLGRMRARSQFGAQGRVHMRLDATMIYTHAMGKDHCTVANQFSRVLCPSFIPMLPSPEKLLAAKRNSP